MQTLPTIFASVVDMRSWEGGVESPVVCLLHCNTSLATDETAHLSGLGCPPDDDDGHACFKVTAGCA